MTATGWTGTLDFIHIAPAKSQPMRRLAEARLVAGKGIEGDRYLARHRHLFGQAWTRTGR